MIKLPVFQTVAEIWRFISRERRDLFFLAAPFVVVLSIINTILIGLAPPGEPGDLAIASLALRVILPIQVTFGIIVTTLFSVTWHRRYLLPEKSLTVSATLNWTQRHWRFLRALVIFFAIYMALIMPFSILVSLLLLFSDPTASTLVPIAAVFPFLMYFLARLSLLFPAAAVDERLTVKACWQRTKNNGWRIFSIYLLSSLPVFLLVAAIGAVISFVVPAASTSITLLFLSGLVRQMAFYFSFAVGISVLSHVYAILTLRPAPPSPV